MSDQLITLLARATLILALHERGSKTILDAEDSDSSVVVPAVSVPSSVS